MKEHPQFLKSRVWEWQRKGAWYFVTIEKPDADEIKKDWICPPKGFGPIPVIVAVGKTTWKTSIFPEKGGTYLLPVKKEVREIMGIGAGDIIELELVVIS